VLEKLESPPINEVVCGFVFEPIRGLDPLLLGTYWQARRSDFPKRDLHPPIVDAPVLLHATSPVRCWFIGADDVFLLQIQPDRFYLNWRRRDDDYPRFSDHPGKGPGILSLALKEFDLFADFCSAEMGIRPVPLRLDLAKIDIFENPLHWKDLNDLVKMIPWLNPFSAFATSQKPDIALRYSEQRGSGTLSVSVDTVRPVDDAERPLLKIETRLSDIAANDIRSDFQKANTALNEVFAALIPKEERDARFQHLG